jgi:hypothetical protein
VDIIAIDDGRKVLFVQVKLNGFPSEKRRKYLRRMRKVPSDHATFEVWVREDYGGWRMYRYDPDEHEFEKYIHMNTCDEEETVERVREEFGYHNE